MLTRAGLVWLNPCGTRANPRLPIDSPVDDTKSQLKRQETAATPSERKRAPLRTCGLPASPPAMQQTGSLFPTPFGEGSSAGRYYTAPARIPGRSKREPCDGPHAAPALLGEGQPGMWPRVRKQRTCFSLIAVCVVSLCVCVCVARACRHLLSCFLLSNKGQGRHKHPEREIFENQQEITTAQ